MTPDLYRVIPALVSRVVRNGGYITKTKLLKLLYLFDVEFYRVHRKTFTEFDWIYYHLGPWTAEYDPLLEQLSAQGALVASATTHTDYDATFYKTPEPVRVFGVLPSRDEAILRTVLRIWGESSTAEILDYIYFKTEPIEHGQRNQPLDFSLIPAERPPKYARAVSGKTPEEINRMKSALTARMSETPDGLVPVTDPPKYDNAFFEFLAKLETEP